jgi:sphingolipid delta-4 desaturase
VGSDEPHASRRKLILEKHPEIKQLMSVDPMFKWTVTAAVLLQLLTFYLIRDITDPITLFLIAYCWVGVINHSMMLAVHEIAHGQAFGQNHVVKNKLFGMFANLPLGFPMSVTFKKYHLKHHRYQGIDVIDTDIPSEWETRIFTNTFLKAIWVMLQPFFYAFRPILIYPLPPEKMEGLNWIVSLSFDYFIVKFFGWHVLAVMVFGSIMAMGMHPVAGHFISEHYIMFNKDDVNQGDKMVDGVVAHNGKPLIPETCSYYGILNKITFNVGYHVEHHDFPSIPGSRLPLVKKIAPEFYDCLPYHSSWTYVLYKYITDPTVGPFARVKRVNKFAGSSSGDSSHLVTNGDPFPVFQAEAAAANGGNGDQNDNFRKAE